MLQSIDLKLAVAISVLLRGLLLAGKFIFMVALARYTTPAVVGVYALVVTVITMLVYLIGAELHTYTTREVVNPKKDQERNRHIQNHGWFVVFGSLLCIPLLWPILNWLNISQQLSIPLMALVLIVEVLCQELARYLIIFSRAVSSNVLQLLRSAAWMPVAIILISKSILSPVNAVLLSWLCGGALAVFFGIWNIRTSLKTIFLFDFRWLATAFKSAKYYFLVALLAQVQAYVDRFVIQYHLGEAQVGIFAFYQSFSNTVQTFIQTGVIAILLPRLLLAAQNMDSSGARTAGKKMLYLSLGIAVIISLLLFFLMPYVLEMIGHQEYQNYLSLFFWLLLGNVFIVAGLSSHMHLYSQRRDKLLVKISLIIVPLGVIANIVLIPSFGLYAAVGVFVLVSALQTLVKLYYSSAALRSMSTSQISS